MQRPPFDKKLSRQIDACYVELEQVQAMRNTPKKVIKWIMLRCKLGKLLRRVPA